MRIFSQSVLDRFNSLNLTEHTYYEKCLVITDAFNKQFSEVYNVKLCVEQQEKPPYTNIFLLNNINTTATSYKQNCYLSKDFGLWLVDLPDTQFTLNNGLILNIINTQFYHVEYVDAVQNINRLSINKAYPSALAKKLKPQELIFTILTTIFTAVISYTTSAANSLDSFTDCVIPVIRNLTLEE